MSRATAAYGVSKKASDPHRLTAIATITNTPGAGTSSATGAALTIGNTPPYDFTADGEDVLNIYLSTKGTAAEGSREYRKIAVQGLGLAETGAEVAAAILENPLAEKYLNVAAAPVTASITFANNPADENTVTISDGTTTEVYEFDNDVSVTGDNIPVTIAGTAALNATALINAINANTELAVTASSGGSGVVTLTLDDPADDDGGFSVSRVGANMTVVDFAGGGVLTVTTKAKGTSVRIYADGGAATEVLDITEVSDATSDAGTGVASDVEVTVTDLAGSYIANADVSLVLYSASTGDTKDSTATVQQVFGTTGGLATGEFSNTATATTDQYGVLQFQVIDSAAGAQDTYLVVTVTESGKSIARQQITTGS